MSARLADVLRKSDVRVLGDLHGRKVGDFAWEKNCGFKTLHELDSLARWAASDGETPAELLRNGDVSGKNDGTHRTVQAQTCCFVVPQSVYELRLHELPITQRLGRVCRSIGVRTLGDLNGRSTSELLQCKECGWRTLAEINQLIECAISGEFDVAPIKESRAAAELLALLELGIAKLSPRERQYLLARIHGLTFAEIGRRHGCTRARAHQVLARALENLRKMWGPRIPRLIQSVKRRCQSMPNGSPLTPALLEQWTRLPQRSGAKAGDSCERFQLSTRAHLRLLVTLDKTIPCYVERPPKAFGSNNLDLDLANLTRALRLATTPEIPSNAGAWPSGYLLKRMLTHM